MNIVAPLLCTRKTDSLGIEGIVSAGNTIKGKNQLQSYLVVEQIFGAKIILELFMHCMVTGI